MPDTPLNSDALEAASRAIDPEAWEVVDKHPDDPGAERLRVSLISEVTKQVAAYLAVALPEVTSVEELDQLPIMTVAMFTIPPLERRMPFELCTINREDKIWMQPGDGAGYRNDMMARYLPATVIYLPEVKP